MQVVGITLRTYLAEQWVNSTRWKTHWLIGMVRYTVLGNMGAGGFETLLIGPVLHFVLHTVRAEVAVKSSDDCLWLLALYFKHLRFFFALLAVAGLVAAKIKYWLKPGPLIHSSSHFRWYSLEPVWAISKVFAFIAENPHLLVRIGGRIWDGTQPIEAQRQSRSDAQQS